MLYFFARVWFAAQVFFFLVEFRKLECSSCEHIRRIGFFSKLKRVKYFSFGNYCDIYIHIHQREKKKSTITISKLFEYVLCVQGRELTHKTCSEFCSQFDVRVKKRYSLSILWSITEQISLEFETMYKDRHCRSYEVKKSRNSRTQISICNRFSNRRRHILGTERKYL